MFITKCASCKKELELPDKCIDWEALASPTPFVFVCDRCEKIVKKVWILIACGYLVGCILYYNFT